MVPDQRPPHTKPVPSISATRRGSMLPAVPMALVRTLKSIAMPQEWVDGLEPLRLAR